MQQEDWGALVTRGEFERCIVLGERRLAEPDLTEGERARLLAALCRSHLHLGAPRQALAAGQALLALPDAAADLRGAALHDLADGLARIADWPGVKQACDLYQAEIQEYTSARCLEGRVLLLRAQADQSEAAACLTQAQGWFDRFGDRSGQVRALHGLIALALRDGDPAGARQLIQQGEALIQAGVDRSAIALHLLDRVAYYRAVDCWEGAVKLAWIALEQAEGDWEMVGRAHLALAEAALGLGEVVDALNFALGAQAAAVAVGAEGLQESARQLQALVRERYGEGPTQELATDYERLLSAGWSEPLTGDD